MARMTDKGCAFVSVVIPTYNCGQFLAAAIDSALCQTHKKFEVIVVNDGSNDDTSEVVRPFLSRINYIVQQNRGLSAARNAGIRESKGDFIAILDADDIWIPTKIEKQLKLFATNHKLGVVGCNGFYVDADGTVIGDFAKPCYSKTQQLRALVLKNFVSGGSEALIKKECFLRIGLFDEQLKSAEDWDMWLRIAQNYEFDFVRESLVKIRIRVNSMSASGNSDKMLVNELRVVSKNFDSLFPGRRLLRKKVTAFRYLSATIGFRESGNRGMVFKCLYKAAVEYPFFIISKLFLFSFYKGIMIRSTRRGNI